MTTDDLRYLDLYVDPEDGSPRRDYVYAVMLAGRRLGTITWVRNNPRSSRGRWRVDGKPAAGTFRLMKEAGAWMLDNYRAGRAVVVERRRRAGVVVEAAAPTRRPRVALRRLIRALGDRKLELYRYRNGGPWVLDFHREDSYGDPVRWTGKPREILAELALLAQSPRRLRGYGLTADEVRAVCGLTRCPMKGFAGYRRRAIESILSLEEVAA